MLSETIQILFILSETIQIILMLSKTIQIILMLLETCFILSKFKVGRTVRICYVEEASLFINPSLIQKKSLKKYFFFVIMHFLIKYDEVAKIIWLNAYQLQNLERT